MSKSRAIPAGFRIVGRDRGFTQADMDWIAYCLAEAYFINQTKQRQVASSIDDFTFRADRIVRSVLAVEGKFRIPCNVAVVSDDDGRMVGFSIVCEVPNDLTGEKEAMIYCLYVDENCRGKGLGRQLLRRAVEWTKSQDLPRITVDVGTENTVALTLLKSMGLSPANIVMGVEFQRS